MMVTKPRLFQTVSAVVLDELVAVDHFYRRLDRILDFRLACPVLE
jgi:hypothetical protein